MAIISSAVAAEEATHENHAVAGDEEHAGAAGTLAHGGAHEGGAFPPFETANFEHQLVWLVLVFGLLYVLMSRIALPRIAGILAHRENTIGSNLDAARELQAKAHAADAQNNATLRAKKEEAQAIGREGQEKIGAEVGALRANAEKKFAEELAAAESRIAAEKAEALSHVESLAKDAAAAIIAKLTGAHVDANVIAAAYRDLPKGH
ncbi:ATPase [Methylocystis heyeri]|uniref:ATP synthase subunit b n=1 Tax=Methylocystis heyeri TaxID=391905 RepID=A0A6B8KH58_9HYPH|nr:ATPase [Methylocystis heyeri]QGM47704.1 ATPase [Methylocystis heyeri]